VAKLQAEHDLERRKACNTVFTTVEILEGILECLPAQTFFTVQRVNKLFHETIAVSLRIQRKMFLRIDNDHSIVWSAEYMDIGNWCLKQMPASSRRAGGAVTPVVLNPCLERVRGPDITAIGAFLGGCENLCVTFHHVFSLQQLEQQSFGKGFFSDPHCKTIQVTLSFRLGFTGFIAVRAMVKSDTPLTIAEVISRTMDTDDRISIFWRRGAFPPSDAVIHEGLPRKIINELKHHTGLELFFIPAESVFQLWDVVAPSDEERAVANSNGLEGNDSFSI